MEGSAALRAGEPKSFREKIVGRTKGGKQVVIAPIANSRLFKIEFRPGGEVPDRLKTRFSDKESAYKAIMKEMGDRIRTDFEEVNW